MLRIITLNLNGIRSAWNKGVLPWMAAQKADIVCLQELKSADEGFPEAEVRAAGYGAVWHGQKSWNGVAILARGCDPVETRRGLPGDPEDEQSRYLECDVDGVVVAALYLPNGNPQPGPKFDYKLRWMERLRDRVAAHLDAFRPCAVLGDFNVCPTDADLAPGALPPTDALVRPESRAQFRALLHLGLTDALRATNGEAGVYTFWDYQAGAWQKNDGVRIDHALLSPEAADRLVCVTIDKHLRAGEKPSDHVPVRVEFR